MSVLGARDRDATVAGIPGWGGNWPELQPVPCLPPTHLVPGGAQGSSCTPYWLAPHPSGTGSRC